MSLGDQNVWFHKSFVHSTYDSLGPGSFSNSQGAATQGHSRCCVAQVPFFLAWNAKFGEMDL